MIDSNTVRTGVLSHCFYPVQARYLGNYPKLESASSVFKQILQTCWMMTTRLADGHK